MQLSKEINAIAIQLQAYPTGSLVCHRNGNFYKWYHKQDGEHIYISKKQREFAERLAMKTYLECSRKDMENEKQVIDCFLRKQESLVSQKNKLMESPEFKILLEKQLHSLSGELEAWQTENYERNTSFPGALIHKSFSGNMVRSKAEALIDEHLFLHKIPYRYECALQMDDHKYFPDFTIRHPITHEIYYWEHFGQADNYDYSKNISSKLHFYLSNNIIPTINLIMTFETKNHPLTAEKVELIIQEYFLTKS